MSVSVVLTYEMSKLIGEECVRVDDASTVAEAVARVRERFGDDSARFDQLSRVTALAVNGVLTNYRRGLRTPLSDGDRVAFVKAAAGG